MEIKEDMLSADHSQKETSSAFGVTHNEVFDLIGDSILGVVEEGERGQARNSQLLCNIWNNNCKFELKVVATFTLHTVMSDPKTAFLMMIAAQTRKAGRGKPE